MTPDKYTRSERAGIAAALRKCKKHLWNGRGHNNLTSKTSKKDKFICWALSTVARTDSTLLFGAEAAKSVICRRLGRAHEMRGWLELQGISPGDITDKLLQAHRLAWVNLLIKEFSA